MGQKEYLGVMIDNSRNAVMNVEATKRFIVLLEKMGYNCLMLYTEDTYEIEEEPYFGHMRGRLSKNEIQEIDVFAHEHNIELMPCIQTLAHLNGIMRWDNYTALKDTDDIICAGDEKVYELIDHMFNSISKAYTSRTVNVGMDEAANIGLGNYLKKNGLENRVDILIKHLNRVSQIANKYGFKLLMWGDMFFRLAGDGNYYDTNIDESLRSKIPDNVTLIYWDYYSYDVKHYDENILNHKKVQDDIWFAGGLWTWTGFVPHIGTAINASKAALKSCLNNNVKNVLLTLWGDNGAECSRFSVLPSLYAASEFYHGNFDVALIKQNFYKMFGIEFDDFSLIELPGTDNTAGFCNNAEKYALYNDCFTGLFDCKIKSDGAAKYAVAAEKLALMCNENEYSYLFKTAKLLCEVLALKYDLGVRTRNAYLEEDKKALKAICNDYNNVVARLEKFYETFEEQWMIENKPFGFDVQDIRLGGLIMRIKHCKNMLAAYIDGRLKNIPELEQPILNVSGALDESGCDAMCMNL